MKIYFLHSIADLNSEYEKLCMERIAELYPEAQIINVKAMLSREDKLKLGKGFGSCSGGGKGFRSVVEKFGYFIDMSDLVIAAKTWNNVAFRGRYTPEAGAELEYAKRKGKKILEFC